MSSAKPIRKDVWPASHYDLGEIRTESAVKPMPPEKKERLESEEIKKRLGNSKAPLIVYLLFKFSSQLQIKLKEFLNNEFALAN